MRAWLPIAALALASLSCRGDDPYAGVFGNGACLPGYVRVPGGACVTPGGSFTVDGLGDDWADSEKYVFHATSCCTDGDAGSLQAAVDNLGNLVLYLDVVGTPVTDGSVLYNVLFRRPDMFYGEDGNQYFNVFFDGTSARLQLNGLEVYGVPIEAAVGADGVEMRVPIAALPMPGAAIIAPETYVRAADGSYLQRDEPEFDDILCWDPTAPEDHCGFN